MMAAGRLTAPGTKHGPCLHRCNHTDCKSTREMAAVECRICDEPIGYERSFFQEKAWTVLVHASCLYQELVDQERRDEHERFSDEMEKRLEATREQRRVTE